MHLTAQSTITKSFKTPGVNFKISITRISGNWMCFKHIRLFIWGLEWYNSFPTFPPWRMPPIVIGRYYSQKLENLAAKKWVPLPFPYDCDLKPLISPFWASTSPLCKIREGRKERLLSLRSLLAIAACDSNLTPFSICSFLAKFPSNLGQVTCLQRTSVFCL